MKTLTQAARDNAQAHAEEINRLMIALEADYSQIEELKDTVLDLRDDLSDVQEELDGVIQNIYSHMEGEEQELPMDEYCQLNEQAAELTHTIRSTTDELAKLQAIAGDFTDSDEVATELHDYPLEVAVRSSWTSIGGQLEPSEYFILLTTGGPAVRIRGELDEYGSPTSAWMEVCGWGGPWLDEYTEYDDALLEFAQFIIPR